MIKLPENFEMDKYGIHVRLVNEGDAEFILQLRTDEKLGRFIHSTDNDLQKQIEWIREYKKREQEGLEYYFIYSYKEECFGLNRIYNRTKDNATTGSWICKPGMNINEVIASFLIERDIYFEILGYPYVVFDVRKQNHKVLRMHQRFPIELIKENEQNYFFKLTLSGYLKGRQRLIKLLNISI